MHNLDIHRNIEALFAFADLVEAHKEELATAEANDNGMPFASNLESLGRATATLRNYSVNASMLDGRISTGGVAIFAPYNDPSFAGLGMSLAAALLVNGWSHPILLKFPNILRSYQKVLQRILDDSKEFPNINFSDDDGKTFMEKVFTSSDFGAIQVYGGPWVQAWTSWASKHGKALKFEGPGNNPAVVDASVDLPKAAQDICGMGYIKAGQACVALSRVLVDDRVDRELFNGLLGDETEATRCGEDPFDDIYVGPIRNGAVTERLKAQMGEATDMGARPFNFAMTPTGNGMLISPTLVFETNHNMRLVSEETFAPVLTVEYAARNRLAELANCTDYGLTASVFGDPLEIEDLRRALERHHGSVLVNTTIKDVATPERGYVGVWGGYKLSSFYVGPNTGWEQVAAPSHLVTDFTKKAE